MSVKDSSTTNLFQHLENKHKHSAEWAECKRLRAAAAAAQAAQQPPPPPPKQTPLGESFSRGVPYDRSERRWIKITEGVAYHIAKDAVPICTVEKPGFKYMMRVTDPRYELLLLGERTAVQVIVTLVSFIYLLFCPCCSLVIYYALCLMLLIVFKYA